MKKILSYILFSLAAHLAWAQSGSGYDPVNPPDPDVYYTLMLEASPRSGGSVGSNDRQKLSVGQSTYLNASPRLGYEFKRWMMGDSLVSTNSSFSFTMPEKDVVLTAYFEWVGNNGYNPVNPDDPDAEGYSHHVYVYATPSAGGYFNSSSFTLVEGKTTNIYAYPREGYRFESWMCNGEVVSTDNPLSIKMGTADIAYTAVFAYNPVSPGEPSPNVFNAATGDVIIDNFTPGSLNNAIYTILGSSENYSLVQSILVIGRMQSSDFGFARSYHNCFLIDLSRTTGYTEVPSYSFEGAEALKELFLPMNVESVGTSAFGGCTALKDIYLYAPTPPALDENALEGLDKSVRLHVPSAAVPLYATAVGWNQLTIKSLDANEKSITVNLPGENGKYKNMTIELQNTQSGQVYRCLVTDRTVYTFYGLMKNTHYNIFLKTAAGVVLGEINDITLTESDLDVDFSDIKTMQDIVLSVVSPDGNNVSADVTITWLDEQGSYLRQGNKITDLLTGTNVRYRLKLGKDLAMEYVQPSDGEYVVKEGENEIVCTLSPIKKITLNGCVKDAVTKQGISDATVSISQTLNGKYSKTTVVRTDNKGNWTATAYNAPTSLAVSAYDYVNQTTEISVDPQNDTVIAEDILLNSIIGVTINVSFTYTNSVAEGETAETQDWYSDYQNIAYRITNLTTGKEITQISERYPQLIILDGAELGDNLRLTAYSKKGAFPDVVLESAIDSTSVIDALFPIKEWGGIKSQYIANENTEVVGMLYDGSGYLKKVYDYANDASLSISGLQDGYYTLITMGKSESYNTIYSLARLRYLLSEGTDYQKNLFAVESGIISIGTIEQVPFFDENKYKYIDKNWSYFNVDNTSIVAGDYLTFTGHIETKDIDASALENIKFIVDLPPSSVFVEKSVMIGGHLVDNYTIEGNTLTIPCPNLSKDKVKFCVIPTESGIYLPSAIVSFTIGDRETMLSIGSASFEVKDMSISVPSKTAKSSVIIKGTATSNGKVDVFDNDVLVGQTTAQANGTWQIIYDLDKPYNLSTHNIYAKVTTEQGIEMLSESKECMYDVCSNSVKTVTMTHYNAYYQENMDVVFDFENKTTTPSSYYYFTTADFSFIVDFTNNDSTVVSDVYVYAFDYKNRSTKIRAIYDGNSDRWIAKHTFSSDDAPVNVSVTFNTYTPTLIDRKIFDDIEINLNGVRQQLSQVEDSLVFLNDNSRAIDIQMDNVEKLYSQLSKDDSGSYSPSILANYLTLLGFPTDESELTSQISEIDLLNKENYIDSLLIRTDSLLNNPFNFEDDDQDFLELIQTSDSILNFLDSKYDIESSLASGYADTVYFEQNGIEWIYYEIPYSSVEEINFAQEEDCLVAELTDGSNCLMVIQEDKYIICDSVQHRIIVMEPAVQGITRKAQRKSSDEDAINKVKSFIQDAPGRINDLTNILKLKIEEFKKQIDVIDIQIKNRNNTLLNYAKENIALTDELKSIQVELNRLDNITSVEDTYRVNELWNRRIALEKRLSFLNERIKVVNEKIGELKKQKNALGAKRLPLLTFVSTLSDLINAVQGVWQTIKSAQACLVDWGEWSVFIDNINKCEDEGAAAIAEKAIKERSSSAVQYGKSIAMSGAASAVSIYMLTNKAAKVVVQILVDYVTDWMRKMSSNMLNSARMKSISKRSELISQLSQLKCKKDEEEKEPENDPADINWDPAGFVYEGVSTNRIEGVTATAYYMETTEDMYGVLHDEPRVWDAEEYDQENPLFTDENGFYQWFVPQGLWQVKLEKEGYETTYSEWLPVPPPQLDVNIAMTQVRQPEVKEAHAYEDGVEITFDKYMQPAYLTADNILVSQDGEYVEGEVKLMDEETAYEDESVKYASRIRFVPETPFTAGEVTLVVANRVRSYADIQMQDTYTQTFDIEKEVKEIVVDEQVKVPYEGTKMITVKVLPADAAAGKTLHAESASSMLASLTNADAIISESGEAQFEVTGELPGATAITFSIDGVQVTASTIVNIEIVEGKVVRVPQASLASGTSVYSGTTVTLSAEEGQKIWYTIDGSCPCDENGSRKLYTQPLTINGDVTIQMMAEDSEGDVSEVVTLTYSILQSKAGVALNNGWTWVSFNMKNNEALASTNTALASGTWTASDVIKDNQYVDMYSAAQHKWIGTMSNHGKLTNTGMYKIHSSQAQKLRLTGEAVHPSKTNISINAGWNYISYVPLVSMTVANALSGYEAQDGDVIKSQDAFATYSTTNGWEGDLTTLDAGKGYMLKRNTSGQTSFCYPIPSTSSSPSNARQESMSHRYADNMNIVGEIYGITVEDGDSLIAYVGGEVRGASRLVNGKKVFLTIHGDAEATVALVLQREGEIIATASDMIGYKSNEVVGTGDAPTAITFSSESVNTGNAIGNIKAIYSMNGMKMGTKRLNAVPAGAYIIYSEIGGNTHITKLIKQ